MSDRIPDPSEGIRNGIGRVTGGIKQQAMGAVRTPLVDRLLSVLTGQETRILSRIQDLHDTLETGEEVRITDPEARKQQIMAAAEARVGGSFDEWYLSEVAGVENADNALSHAGTDWETYAESVAQQYDAEDLPDGVETTDEIAASHIRSAHEVDRETFEATVLQWGDELRSQALGDVLAGPLREAEAGIDAAIQHVEAADAEDDQRWNENRIDPYEDVGDEPDQEESEEA